MNTQIQERARRIVNHALQEVGGATELVRRHEHGMLPALLESAYVLLLSEEEHEPPARVAAQLGIPEGKVASILSAPTYHAVARLRDSGDQAEFESHTDPEWSGTPSEPRLEPEFLAGALAKFAYDIVIREDAHSGKGSAKRGLETTR